MIEATEERFVPSDEVLQNIKPDEETESVRSELEKRQALSAYRVRVHSQGQEVEKEALTPEEQKDYLTLLEEEKTDFVKPNPLTTEEWLQYRELSIGFHKEKLTEKQTAAFMNLQHRLDRFGADKPRDINEADNS